MIKNSKVRRQLTMLTLVAALGTAIYLNWEYAKNDPTLTLKDDTQIVSTLNEDIPIEVNGNILNEDIVEDMLPDQAGNKNYGDAQLVSAGTDTSKEYFEKATLSRDKLRDEALDVLQKSLKNAKLTQEEKDGLVNNLTSILTGITAEGDIESMVLAKGFANCLAVIDGDKVNVSVSTGGVELSPDKVAQIKDIILQKFTTDAKNITIVEVK